MPLSLGNLHRIDRRIISPVSVLATIVTVAGLGLCLALAAAVWRQHGSAARFMAALLLCIAAQMGGNAMLASGVILQLPHLSQLHTPLAFAIGPLFYAHIRSLTQRHLSRAALVAHLLPAVVITLLLVPFYLQDADAKSGFLSNALHSYPRAWTIRQAVLVIQMGAYIALAIRLWREAVTRTPRLAVVWTTPLLRAMPVMWLITAVRFATAYEASTSTYATAFATVALGLVVASNLTLPRLKVAADDGDGEADECLRAATALMQDEEVFRDRQLTLEVLAQRVGTTPHFLSAVVNRYAGRSVPDWINGFRVEAVKRQLANPGDGRSIQQIAEACGFSSRSAFNAAFRRHTGTTPGEFRIRRRADS